MKEIGVKAKLLDCLSLLKTHGILDELHEYEVTDLKERIIKVCDEEE